MHGKHNLCTAVLHSVDSETSTELHSLSTNVLSTKHDKSCIITVYRQIKFTTKESLFLLDSVCTPDSSDKLC